MHNQFIQARKHQNLTLEQVHQKTKIATHDLAAIEQGAFAKLPNHIATSYINT